MTLVLSNFTATPAGDSVQLSWTTDGDKTITRYEVHAGNFAGFTPDTSNNTTLIFRGIQYPQCTFLLGYGKTLYFKVRAISATSQGAFVSVTGSSAAAPVGKPTVTGSRGGNAALASLLSGLATAGTVTDSTTA